MASEEDIKGALDYLGEHWQKQNDELDRLTKFVYEIDDLDLILTVCDRKNIDRNYALHRWYNFNCARYHEYLFCKNGAEKEEDLHHKTIDFRINGVAFDLKTSVYPKRFRQNSDLSRRANKNELIRWLYQNQSAEGRQHFDNRLFLVCRDLQSKSNFELIEQKIRAFIDYSNEKGFNEIEINNKLICSDVIWIEY